MYTSSWTTCLLVSLLCTLSLSVRVPVKDVRVMMQDKERREAAENKLVAREAAEAHKNEKRLICIYDGVLTGMLNDLEDAVPFCSSYIGIQDVTGTQVATTRTTVTSIFTTYEDVAGPSVTVAGTTVTETVVSFPEQQAKAKRQEIPGVTPFASLAAACTDTPLNRTLKSRVSSGCSCLRIGPGTVYVTSTSTSTRIFTGIDYQQTTIPVTVTIPGTQTITVTVPPVSVPTGPRGESDSISSTSVLPPVSISTVTPATTGGTGNATYSFGTGTGVTPSSTRTGISSSGSYTGNPTLNPDTRTQNPQTGTGPSLNPSPVLNVTSTPVVLPPTNTSTYLPTGTSSSYPPVDGCPIRNGTTYEAQCQLFVLACYVNYNGPTFQGLLEDDLNSCIRDCATVNVGFSQDRCYGVTFNTSITSGNNCFFKTEIAVAAPEFSIWAVSARLINNDTCGINASSVAPTLVPTGSIIVPTGPGLSLNVSSRAGKTTASGSSASITPLGNLTTSTFNPTAPPLSVPSNTRQGNSNSAPSGFYTFPSNSSYSGYSTASSNGTTPSVCVTSISTVTETTTVRITFLPQTFA